MRLALALWLATKSGKEIPMLWWTLKQLKSKNPKTREHAAEKLGKSGNAKAVEPLINALKDENDYVSAEATIALGEIGDAHAVEPLIAVLKDENNFLRQKAAEALGKIGDARATNSSLLGLKTLMHGFVVTQS